MEQEGEPRKKTAKIFCLFELFDRIKMGHLIEKGHSSINYDGIIGHPNAKIKN